MSGAGAERRERYALALSTRDGWRAEHVERHGQRPEYYADADAVMAVADQELAPLRLAAKTVTDNDWYGRLARAIDALNRIEQWARSTEHGEAAADVLSILEGVG